MISKEKLDKILVSFAGVTNAILIVTMNYFLKAEHPLICAAVSIICSSLFSWGFIFFAIRAIVIFTLHRVKNEYFVGTGNWFCVYYNESMPEKYMRVGTLKLEQILYEVKMINLETRNAIIDKDNSKVYGFYSTDPQMGTSSQRVSKAKGKYYIDFELSTLKGFFEMKNDRNNDGVNILRIEKQQSKWSTPQKIDGVFLNAHYKQDVSQRPAAGLVALFKDRIQTEKFIMDLVKLSFAKNQGEANRD